METVSIRKSGNRGHKSRVDRNRGPKCLDVRQRTHVMGIFMEEEQALKAREKFQTRYQEVFLLSSMFSKEK